MRIITNAKLLNVLLILTSLIGYLEWGGGNSAFLFQVEAEVLSKFFSNPGSVIHPLTVLPLTGQLLLAVTLFQKRPNRILTFIGVAGIGLLLAFVFIAGLLGLNFQVFLSTLPFLIVAALVIRHHRRRSPQIVES